MKVKLISYTQDPIKTIYRAYRTCYSKNAPTEIKIPNTEQIVDFIKKYIQHESPLEHCSFTFSIEGVSRSLLAQLTRHRLASYSVQSQRYVSNNNFNYIIPPNTVKINSKTLAAYCYLMKEINSCYNTLIELGIPKEDARYVLPNATVTNLITTMNLREFRHFYAERSCKKAQWEIRKLAELLMDEVKQIIPFADYKSKNCGITCFECNKKI